MQLFWFFYTNKRTGSVGAKPPQAIKLKKLKLTKYSCLGIYWKFLTLSASSSTSTLFGTLCWHIPHGITYSYRILYLIITADYISLHISKCTIFSTSLGRYTINWPKKLNHYALYNEKVKFIFSSLKLKNSKREWVTLAAWLPAPYCWTFKIVDYRCGLLLAVVATRTELPTL